MRYGDYFRKKNENATMAQKPSIDNVGQIEKLILARTLCGKLITNIAFISEITNYTRSNLERYAYEAFGGLKEAERIESARYCNIDEHLAVPLEAITYGAVMIRFRDNSHFEIGVGEDGKFWFAMDRIPWAAFRDSQFRNLDEPEVVFAPVMNEAIKGIDVEYDEANGVTAIKLLLTNKKRILFDIADEQCHMLLQETRWTEVTTSTISFGKLKEFLINDEDVHSDENIGFISDCKMIWTGELGKKVAKGLGRPIIAIADCLDDPIIYLRESDFRLFYLAIFVFKGDTLWEPNEAYTEFTQYEWDKLLDLVIEFSNYSSYEKLCEYIKVSGRKYYGVRCDEYLDSLNESILIRKDDTNELVDNLRLWTKHALMPGNTIWVHKLRSK